MTDGGGTRLSLSQLLGVGGGVETFIRAAHRGRLVGRLNIVGLVVGGSESLRGSLIFLLAEKLHPSPFVRLPLPYLKGFSDQEFSRVESDFSPFGVKVFLLLESGFARVPRVKLDEPIGLRAAVEVLVEMDQAWGSELFYGCDNLILGFENGLGLEEDAGFGLGLLG